MNNEILRLECLRLAVDCTDNLHEAIKTARTFYKFIIEEEEQEQITPEMQTILNQNIHYFKPKN